MSEDKPKGEDKPKMKFPPLKKKHRILGELPPDSLAAALNYRELGEEVGREEAQNNEQVKHR
ncbi:MAG TPA: hypothetical protein VFS21_09105 [Roseiflexaceae bacterium]|nr:hypothetical protein [Roseiflexaceae bacterium]